MTIASTHVRHLPPQAHLNRNPGPQAFPNRYPLQQTNGYMQNRPMLNKPEPYVRPAYPNPPHVAIPPPASATSSVSNSAASVDAADLEAFWNDVEEDLATQSQLKQTVYPAAAEIPQQPQVFQQSISVNQARPNVPPRQVAPAIQQAQPRPPGPVQYLQRPPVPSQIRPQQGNPPVVIHSRPPVPQPAAVQTAQPRPVLQHVQRPPVPSQNRPQQTPQQQGWAQRPRGPLLVNQPGQPSPRSFGGYPAAQPIRPIPVQRSQTSPHLQIPTPSPGSSQNLENIPPVSSQRNVPAGNEPNDLLEKLVALEKENTVLQGKVITLEKKEKQGNSTKDHDKEAKEREFRELFDSNLQLQKKNQELSEQLQKTKKKLEDELIFIKHDNTRIAENLETAQKECEKLAEENGQLKDRLQSADTGGLARRNSRFDNPNYFPTEKDFYGPTIKRTRTGSDKENAVQCVTKSLADIALQTSSRVAPPVAVQSEYVQAEVEMMDESVAVPSQPEKEYSSARCLLEFLDYSSCSSESGGLYPVCHSHPLFHLSEKAKSKIRGADELRKTWFMIAEARHFALATLEILRRSSGDAPPPADLDLEALLLGLVPLFAVHIRCMISVFYNFVQISTSICESIPDVEARRSMSLAQLYARYSGCDETERSVKLVEDIERSGALCLKFLRRILQIRPDFTKFLSLEYSSPLDFLTMILADHPSIQVLLDEAGDGPAEKELGPFTDNASPPKALSPERLVLLLSRENAGCFGVRETVIARCCGITEQLVSCSVVHLAFTLMNCGLLKFQSHDHMTRAAWIVYLVADAVPPENRGMFVELLHKEDCLLSYIEASVGSGFSCTVPISHLLLLMSGWEDVCFCNTDPKRCWLVTLIETVFPPVKRNRRRIQNLVEDFSVDSKTMEAQLLAVKLLGKLVVHTDLNGQMEIVKSTECWRRVAEAVAYKLAGYAQMIDPFGLDVDPLEKCPDAIELFIQFCGVWILALDYQGLDHSVIHPILCTSNCYLSKAAGHLRHVVDTFGESCADVVKPFIEVVDERFDPMRPDFFRYVNPGQDAATGFGPSDGLGNFSFREASASDDDDEIEME